MTKAQTMRSLTQERLAELSSTAKPPCLSLYQPTHRRHPDNQQDPIRFGNLVKELEASVRQGYPAVDVRPLLQPFEALARDTEFWNNTLDGLVVLSGPGVFETYNLPQNVAELAVVADSFHTKPLRRYLQTVDRFQVLALSLDKIRIFEGNRHALDELAPVAGVPRTITEALGAELTEPHQTVASYGGIGGAPMHHGQGGKADEVDIDMERFFRAVDRAVMEHHSKPSGLPLILAALPEHHHMFHQVSQNALLVAEGVKINPSALSLDQLRQHAWTVVEPVYQARLATQAEAFAQARGKGLGSDDLTEVAKASTTGRIATLLIEADRHIPGHFDETTGSLERAEMGHPQVDDLLDDLSEHVALKGGNVVVIPSDRMPTKTGIAATYRF